MVQALYNGNIDAMIYNQALDELIEENNPGFLEKVRIIDNFNVETQVLMEDVPDLPITKQPFIVYLSGMDVYGELEQTSRSDVNIMACVNPATKQVLLVSVPRDAYVEIPGITNGEKDKLTHAGMYGVQYSMASMEEIFDVDISYYVRVNFTSLIMMVDALGGVDVESEYAFSTYYKQYDAENDSWSYYEYSKGENHLDGAYALAFARERMNLPGGLPAGEKSAEGDCGPSGKIKIAGDSYRIYRSSVQSGRKNGYKPVFPADCQPRKNAVK